MKLGNAEKRRSIKNEKRRNRDLKNHKYWRYQARRIKTKWTLSKQPSNLNDATR